MWNYPLESILQAFSLWLLSLTREEAFNILPAVWQHTKVERGKRSEWEGAWLGGKQVFKFLLDSSVFSPGSLFSALTEVSKIKGFLSPSFQRVALLHSAGGSTLTLTFKVSSASDPKFPGVLHGSKVLWPPRIKRQVSVDTSFQLDRLMNASPTDYGWSEAVWLLKLGHRGQAASTWLSWDPPLRTQPPCCEEAKQPHVEAKCRWSSWQSQLRSQPRAGINCQTYERSSFQMIPAPSFRAVPTDATWCRDELFPPRPSQISASWAN